jgi:hypothetical protein
VPLSAPESVFLLVSIVVIVTLAWSQLSGPVVRRELKRYERMVEKKLPHAAPNSLNWTDHTCVEDLGYLKKSLQTASKMNNRRSSWYESKISACDNLLKQWDSFPLSKDAYYASIEEIFSKLRESGKITNPSRPDLTPHVAVVSCTAKNVEQLCTKSSPQMVSIFRNSLISGPVHDYLHFKEDAEAHVSSSSSHLVVAPLFVLSEVFNVILDEHIAQQPSGFFNWDTWRPVSSPVPVQDLDLELLKMLWAKSYPTQPLDKIVQATRALSRGENSHRLKSRN